ncbi:MAG TPA: hypothetical protein VGW75_14060 [Solirubrobacteraceae bacterium]|nr:hypothetical protein [Solirubrobacteraceae bacterium]
MAPNGRSPTDVLTALGLADQASAIEDGTAELFIFTMTAHMDWDWVLPFPILVEGPGTSSGSGAQTYFDQGHSPAVQILSAAASQLEQDSRYRYMVVEMGFLRAFADADPASFAQLVAAGDRIHLCGAGVTSPDSLLPHVEAFFRTYLLGRLWAEQALPDATISQSYLPDDFGHDPELPATLAAMGIEGTAFARIPGHWGPGQDPKASPGLDCKPSQATTLFDAGDVDFVWTASDGSTVLAHWMPNWYSGTSPPDDPQSTDVQTVLNQSVGAASGSRTLIQASPTRYAYNGLGNDFRLPVDKLAAGIADWNAKPLQVDGLAPGVTAVYCALGSFDDFVTLALASQTSLKAYGTGAPNPLFTTPYFVGSQATRPALKSLHQRAVRALLAAETLVAANLGRGWSWAELSAVTGRQPADLLAEAWALVVPSTHHDYITGTGHPDVYRTEQLPLLRAAVARAESLGEDALAGIAARLAPGDSGYSVAVFNPAGFERTVLAECEWGALGQCDAVEDPGGTVCPLQPTGDGRVLVRAPDVPAQGYAVMTGSYDTPPQLTNAARATSAGLTVTLSNGLLTVVLTPTGGWGIASITDVAGDQQVVPGGDIANAIAIYDDADGNEYVLGCEKGPGFDDVTPTLTAGALEVVEDGPLRARVRATFTCQDPAGGGDVLVFTREYALHCDEPILRMSLTGRAPYGMSVGVKFPFGSPIDTLTRGTPGHWTDQTPQLLWSGLTTHACHHFTVASSSGTPLAGMLHRDVHAWGLWSDDKGDAGADCTLYGLLLRNPTGNYFSWTTPAGAFPGGTDPDVHTCEYALLAPSQCTALSPPVVPLRAGVHFATPPLVAPVSQYLTDATPPPASLSFASASAPALVTAVKLGSRDPGTLVVRLQHPDPSGADVTLTVDANTIPGWSQGKSVDASLLTALEEPLGSIAGVTVDGNAATVTVPLPMARAFATVGLAVAS